MKDRNLFLDSKTIPRTFSALEAKLGTKTRRKRYNGVATEEQLHDSRKAKRKLKGKDGLPPNMGLSWALLLLGSALRIIIPLF